MINDDWDEKDDKAIDEFIGQVYDDIEARNKEIAAFYTELDGESARAAAILIVVQIDEELTKIIARYFPADVDKKVWKQLFGSNGPIGNLKNKCLMAQALGAFGQETKKTIEKMGEIRNKFAHVSNVRSFKHPEVLKLCIDLKDNPIFPYGLIDTASEREIRTSLIVTARCLHQRLEMIAPRVSGLGDPKGPLP